MNVMVTFRDDDTPRWAALEATVGPSTANRPDGPNEELLVLIWKACTAARVVEIVRSAVVNPGCLGIIVLPARDAPSEPVQPLLRLVE